MFGTRFGPGGETIGYLLPLGDFPTNARPDLGQGPLRVGVIPGEAAMDLQQAIRVSFQRDELRAPPIEELVGSSTFAKDGLCGLVGG